MEKRFWIKNCVKRVLLIDLSKAFVTLNHILSLAKFIHIALLEIIINILVTNVKAQKVIKI